MSFFSRKRGAGASGVRLMMLQLLIGALMSLSVNAFSTSYVKPTPMAIFRGGNVRATACFTRHYYESSCLAITKCPGRRGKSVLKSSSREEADSGGDDDPLFDIRTTISLVGGQSLLILAAVIAAVLLKIPNYGLGLSISFSRQAWTQGLLYALPLFALAYALDGIEKNVPALQDVTKATQRSVIALLGGRLKPLLAIAVSCALGLVAGFGEEMLFRGVMQYGLSTKFGTLVGVSISSVIFGLLHAVTPLYALLATLASVFFGSLYVSSGNLAVPIITHGVYDVGALLWAHWTVTQMTPQERQEIVDWNGPTSSKKSDD